MGKVAVDRYTDFSSLRGRNWVVGRYLLPILEKWGRGDAGVILDLGCGESPFRRLFVTAKDYIRVDRKGIGDRIVMGDLCSIPCANGSVDTVLMSQVLSDVPNPIASLEEVTRVLRPGGCLIVFESMCYPEHDLPDDYFRIMPAGAEYLASKAGLETIEVIRLGGFFTRIAMLWNTFTMGTLANQVFLKPLAYAGIILGNILCYSLDRILMHPRLASDYVARFCKKPPRD